MFVETNILNYTINNFVTSDMGRINEKRNNAPIGNTTGLKRSAL